MKKYLLIALLVSSVPVFAGSLKTDNPERKPENQVLMTEQQYKKIQKFSEMLAEEKFTEAKSGLEGMLAQTREGRDAYIQAVIYQLLGHISTLQDNMKGASDYFKKAIDLDALPNKTHFDMMLTRAQFVMLDGNYRGTLEALKEYFAQVDEIPDKAFAIKANSHARLNQFQEAKAALLQAIELADKPVENWYQQLLSIHSQLNEYQQMVGVLEILIQLKPDNKTYWKQLSSVYFTLKQEKKALAIHELAYEKGLLSEENEFLQLYKYYALNEIPYKAAASLQKFLDEKKVKGTFKHWKQAGALWYEAKELEKALAAYAKASELAEDGDMDLTRAYLYSYQEDFSNAKTALRAALQKGGLTERKTAEAWLMLGMSEASLKNFSQARDAFNQAKKYERTRKDANEWLNHLTTLEQQQIASAG